MNFNLDSDTYGSVHFKRAALPALSKWLIPGSQPYSVKGPFGSIMIQQINAGAAKLFYTSCNIRKDLALDFSSDRPFCLTHIALKNENRFDIPGADNVYMKEGQFNMIRSSSIKGTFYMERGHDYRMFSIYYPGRQLQELLPFFPFLDRFTNETCDSRAELLFKNHHWINAQIRELAGLLLQCHYRGSLRQLFLDYKIKELLFLLLSQEYTETTTGNGVSKRIIEAINEARYIMEEGNGSTVTLNKIARQVGISEVKLKSGLKLLFGI